MKIRNGFVSNSSSTNFMVIGVEVDDKKVSPAINFVEEIKRRKNWEEIETYNGKGNIDDTLIAYSFSFKIGIIGIPIIQLMETMNAPQLRRYFHDYVQKTYNIDIPLSDINVHFGEAGN